MGQSENENDDPTNFVNPELFVQPDAPLKDLDPGTQHVLKKDEHKSHEGKKPPSFIKIDAFGEPRNQSKGPA